MDEKMCLVCGMKINSKNMLFNKYSFIKQNEKDNIVYCPFCGVDKKYLKEDNEAYEINRNNLDKKSIDILQKAMKLETFNGDFYTEASKMSKDKNIKKLFKDLANIEFMHARVHKNLGGFKELPKLHKPDYSRHDTDLLLLKEASNREKHAISFYKSNYDNISNKTVKKIIAALADVENQHIIIAENYMN